MALWMTAEQEWFGLAALLLVFSCAFWCGAFHARGRGEEKGRRSAFFAAKERALIKAGLLLWCGLALGAGRMEYEEWRCREVQCTIEEVCGQEIHVEGQVAEIQETGYGVRLQMQTCRILQEREGEEVRIGGLYVYVDSAADLENVHLGQKLTASGTCKLPERDRNPGGFDYRSYCLSRGVYGIFTADTVRMAEEGTGKVKIDWYLREKLRQTRLLLERQLEQIADGEDLGILKAVILGQKSELDDAVYERYRKNGISHILAISGLHVSVIGMGLWKGLRKLGLGYPAAGGLAFGVLLAYGIMAGFGPSVVRAVFMMGISFLAGIFGRTYDLPSALCVPALGLLLGRPYLLTQASFQLSFLAVGAMVVPGAYLAKRWNLRGVSQNIWISASLQVMTLPVILRQFFEVPVFGMALNLAVVPLMSYVLISGILGIAGSFLNMQIGSFFLGGAHCILSLYETLCLWVQKIPFANAVLGAPDWKRILLYYGWILLGTWLAGTRGASGKRWLGLWGIAVLLLIPWRKPGLSVTFLDVGQGDGIYLEAAGRNLLVDGGSSQEKAVGEEILVPFLKSRGVTKLDTVMLSHGDLDHVSGIRDLLEDEESEISIGKIFFTRGSGADEVSEELVELARARGIQVGFCGSGDALDGLLGPEIGLKCLHPAESVEKNGQYEKDRNENSMVLHLTYGNFSMLLTGDIGQETEKSLMKRDMLSPVTVLKAAHHGSAGSSSLAFLETVRPAYVIFSYGEGNNPTQIVIQA